jgi:large subunit ribosomal protein L4
MSTLAIRNMKGEVVGQYEWPDDRLVLDRGDAALHQVVVAHLAACRAGTHNTRGKGEVAGSNRKPWRQKGTGRARAGYRRSPIWRGGGVAHGPHPRDYTVEVPRKMARLAFARAWSSRVAAGDVVVLDSVELPEPKTRHVAAMQSALGLGESCLFVVESPQPALVRAARNLPRVAVVTARELDAYTVLKYGHIVATRAAMDVLAERCGEVTAGKAVES